MKLNGLPNESRTFMGGMVKDVMAALLKKNQYTEAMNMKLTEPNSETLGGMTVSIGNEQVADVTVGYEQGRKAYRITLDNTASGIAHDFDWNGVAGAAVISVEANAALRYANLVQQVIDSAAGQSVTITVSTTSPIAGTAALLHLGISSTTDFTVTEEITSVDVDCFIIHEYYSTGTGVPFRVLKSLNIGEDLYTISTNGEVFRWAVGKKDETTGNWTYTVILETATITIDDEAVIDLDGEVDFQTRVSQYLIGEGVAPRCLYVTHEDTWENQYSFIWTEAAAYIEAGNPNGFYTHENVAEKTHLQILQNYARINGPGLLSVNNTGGALPTGGYYYLFRQLSSNQAATNFSLISGLVPIFEDVLTDTELSGSNGGLATSKSVTLPIIGLDPTLYDQFEIGVVVNINGVLSSYVIGPYKLTSATQTIIHTGFEVKGTLSTSELLAQQILIREGKNLVINRNRLFVSNFTTQLDYDLSEYCVSTAGNITLATHRTPLASCGTVDVPVVAEYQVPENVFEYAAYMLNETYRIGIIFFFRTGFVSSPYFIEDFQLTYASGDLTDNAGGVPENFYAYHPRATVDLSVFPAIEGVPFENAVYGYSLVRLPCVPEVQKTGYAMLYSADHDGYYNVGRHVSENITYGAGPTETFRRMLGCIWPEALFNENTGDVAVGDKLYNYGQPFLYNDNVTGEAGATPEFNFIKEYSGDFTAQYEEVIVSDSQIVPFNETGTKQLTGYKYSTVVVQPNNKGGNNQSSTGVELDTGNYAVARTGNTDRAFYYVQHVKIVPNKYGETSSGNYISCNHFRVLNGAGPYTDDLFGGDTFTQKNITKLMNLDTFSSTVSAGFVVSPIGSFSVGSYTWTLIGLLPDGITTISATPAVLAVSPGDVAKSVVLAWDNSLGIVWNLYRTDPGLGSPTYLVFTGTGTTFTDQGSIATPAAIPAADCTQVTIKTGLTYYSQNRINTQLRYFTDTEENLNYPYQTASLTEWLADELDEGTLLYSQSYTPTTSVQTMLAYDPDAPANDKYGNILQYSDFKIGESPSDTYRVFRPFNRKSLPAIYGSVNNMFRYRNYLILLLDDVALAQEIDQQVTISGANGQPIQVGDGTVLGAKEEVISNYGSQTKTAAVQYICEGQVYIAWYDGRNKKFMRRGVDGVKDLTQANYIQSFVNVNNQFIGAERSMVMGYDDYSKELLVSTNAEVPDSEAWDDSSTFTAGTIVTTGLDNQTTEHWEALINVPADTDPRDPANRLQYWKPYFNSNYTLAFNEKLNAWSGFYSYKTTLFLPYKNTFLTWYFVNSGDNPTSDLYEHNRGDALVWYGVEFYGYLKNVFNDIPDYFKQSRNLWLRCTNQPYYLHVKGNNTTKTYGEQADFIQEREYYWLAVKNDATLNGPTLPTGTNTTGINTLCTAWIEGETIEATIFFDEENLINETMHRYKPKGKFPGR